ncbi:hypothetical protein G6L37_07545 [Agrobacterium rubi]|nr:hypothetical protein [Agrobacterium rubi]NTF25222.1 hypothetical protein [Agrobacterium rubi]
MTDSYEVGRPCAPDATTLTGLALTVEPRRRYDKSTGKYRKSKWSALSDAAADFLMREGRPAENIRSVIMTGQGRNFRFRRDIPWKDFPHIQRPIHDYGRAYIADFLMKDGKLTSRPHFNFWDHYIGTGRQNTVGRKMSRAALTSDLDRIEEILVVADPWDDKLVWESVAPVFTVNPDVVVWHMPFYSPPRRIERTELERLERKFRAHDHLIYNYTFNMIVLGSRARHAAALMGPHPAMLARSGYRLFNEEHEDAAMDPTAAFSPLAIGVLQILDQSAGPIISAAEGEPNLGKKWREPFSKLPFMSCKADGEVFLNWTGSGKFDPWIEKLTQINNPPVYGTEGASEHLHDIASLYTEGLATVHNGRVVITNTGKAFLDILDDSVRDPDLLLRWRQSSDVIAGEEDFPAIDRWLATKFRRLKRRVAALPSSPLTEPGHHLRIKPRNVIAIRGYRIAADKWSLEERTKIATAVESANEGIPLREQSVGIITSDDPFDKDEVPVAFWVGRCLAVVPSERGFAWQYNCNLDTTSIDAHLFQPDRLPVQLRDLTALTLRPTFIGVDTEELEDEFLTLPQHIPMATGRSLAGLYFGKAVFPKDMSKWRQNAIIKEIENPQNECYGGRHPADPSEPVRCIFRYKADSSEKEPGFLVGMRVGFAVLKGESLLSDKVCEAVMEIPEASWEMPIVDFFGDPAISEELEQVEPALWYGFSQPIQRVTSIRRDGGTVTLELAPSAEERHPVSS